MPQGTGVATYGAALGQAVRSLGVSLDGLFGVPVGTEERLREVLFFEALERGYVRPRGSATWRWLKTWTEPLRHFPVVPVSESALVDRSYFVDRLPAFDRILSSPYLFERAERHFIRTRRFLRIAVDDPPALMHWTYPVPITLSGCPNIYTLHDLVPLRLPHATLDRKRYYYRLVKRLASDADHLCTVSEASRNDIISLFGVEPKRVSNTYQTAPIPEELNLVSRSQSAQDIEGVFALQQRGYFLYFGAIEPKKNVGRLVEAYLSIRTDTPLVIVGARAWTSERETALIAAAQARSAGTSAGGQRIVVMDYLPRRLLMMLVAGARAVAFPSLYEGFGLPLLEAMQLGTPVLIGNRTSLPEIAGGAALAVDPYSVSDIAQGLRRLDGEPRLRADLTREGCERAQFFSLAAYRERLHAMYSAVLAS